MSDVPDILRITWLEHRDGGDVDRQLPGLAKEICGWPGIRAAAAYSLTSGGEDMIKLGAALPRATYDEDRAPTWLLLTVFDSGESALATEEALRAREDKVDGDVLLRAGYVEFMRGRGSGDELSPNELGPAIQLGTFDMQSPEDDLELAQWYVKHRFPDFAAMPGTLRVRRWYSVWGPFKGAVLYEFTSLEDRLTHFERPLESMALDRTHPTGSIVARTRHAWLSPSIGRQITA